MAQAAHPPEGSKLKTWTLGKLLGRGAFGGVFEARADGDPIPYALKVVTLKGVGASKLTKGMTQSREAALLYKEYNLYAVHFKHPESRHLARLAPKAPYGEDGTYRWLAMQRMGASLHKCLQAGGGSAPWPTVANIAVQILEALEYIHSKKQLYIDVNAENFMVGAGAGDAHTLFVIDFGLSEPARTVMGEAKPATENGTPLFSSRAPSLGRPMSAWDDLESAGYLLLFCAAGQGFLPWGAAKSAPEAAKAKLAASPASLTAGLTATGAPPAAASALRTYLTAVWEGTAAAAAAAAAGPAPAGGKAAFASSSSSSSAAAAARPAAPPPPDYAGLRALFAPHAGPKLVWTHAPASGAKGRRRSSGVGMAADSPAATARKRRSSGVTAAAAAAALASDRSPSPAPRAAGARSTGKGAQREPATVSAPAAAISVDDDDDGEAVASPRGRGRKVASAPARGTAASAPAPAAVSSIMDRIKKAQASVAAPASSAPASAPAAARKPAARKAPAPRKRKAAPAGAGAKADDDDDEVEIVEDTHATSSVAAPVSAPARTGRRAAAAASIAVDVAGNSLNDDFANGMGGSAAVPSPAPTAAPARKSVGTSPIDFGGLAGPISGGKRKLGSRSRAAESASARQPAPSETHKRTRTTFSASAAPPKSSASQEDPVGNNRADRASSGSAASGRAAASNDRDHDDDEEDGDIALYDVGDEDSDGSAGGGASAGAAGASSSSMIGRLIDGVKSRARESLASLGLGPRMPNDSRGQGEDDDDDEEEEVYDDSDE